MRYYNTRNKLGQFSNTKTLRRKKAVSVMVRNGSLYDWNGSTVRVLSDLNNGMKLVGMHKRLFGFAKVSELQKIGPIEVNAYLNS
jgi:hypothetical protein